MNQKELSPPTNIPEDKEKILNHVFSNISNLIEFDLSDELLNQINNSVNNDRLVVFVGNHQGYFEVEVWALIAKKLSEKNPEFGGIYLPYSEPATDANVGELLRKREEYYNQNKLFLLPVIRENDRINDKYKDFITPQMEKNNSASSSIMAHARKKHMAIVSLPEGSMKGGRINKETEKIFGMQKIEGKTFLDMIFKEDSKEDSKIKKIKNKLNKFKLIHYTDLVPIGIDGSSKVLSSEDNTFSKNIISWINNKEKVVTAKAKKMISAIEYSSLKKNVVNFIMQKEVAPLVSPDARGIYHSSTRKNLESIN